MIERVWLVRYVNADFYVWDRERQQLVKLQSTRDAGPKPAGYYAPSYPKMPRRLPDNWKD